MFSSEKSGKKKTPLARSETLAQAGELSIDTMDTPGFIPGKKSLIERLGNARRKCKFTTQQEFNKIPVVDLLKRDLSLHVSGKRKPGEIYLPPVSGKPESLSRNQIRKDFPKFNQFGIFIDNFLSIRRTNNHISALCKLMKLFGFISKNKHFKFVLKCFVLGGCSPQDFKSLMRIRDIYIRGHYLPYEKAIKRFIWSLPRVIREATSVFRKVRRDRHHR